MSGKLQVLFLFMFLLSFSGKGQELFFTNLNSSVLLPSQECYKILQDDEGYIWFSTDKGLCRYSSGKLQVFDKKNGLPEESVYAIEKDKTGKMWFCTSENRLLNFENGKFKEPAFTREFKKQDRDASGVPPIISMNVEHPNVIELVTNFNSFTLDKNSGKITPHKRDNSSTIKIRKSNPSDRYLFGISFLGMQKKVKMDVTSGHRTKMIVLNEFPVTEIGFRMICSARAKNLDLISMGGRVVVLWDDLSYDIMPFPSDVLSMTVDEKGGVWIGVRNNGVYYYKDIRTRKYDHHSLRGYSVSDIALDDENGVWCSTLEHGIYYCSNRYILSYINEGFNRQLVRIKSVNGRLFLAKVDQLWFFEKGNFSNFRENFVFPYLHDFYYFKDKWYVCGSTLMTRTDKNLKKHEELFIKLKGFVEILASGNSYTEYEGKLYLGGNSYISEVNETSYLNHVKGSFVQMAIHTMADGKGNILLGNKKGAFLYNIARRDITSIASSPPNIVRFVKNTSGEIWIASKNDGIFIYTNNQIKKIPGVNGLEGVRFFDIDNDDEGNIWAASNRGIYHFVKKNGRYITFNYKVSNGLPSNEIYNVAFHEGQVWFSAFEGLFCLTEPKKMHSAIRPRILMKSATVNRKPQRKMHTIYVDDADEPVNLCFDFLSYKDAASVKLHYLHIDPSGDTVSTTVSGYEINFAGLEPGNHKLIVRGVNFDGAESSSPQVISIIVSKPYYLTWWFITFCVILLIFLFILFLRYFTGRIRRREKAETQINKRLAEFQMTALQAQMNPHFIFNAINTIQGYILQRNEEEAYKYLAKFSKLIRIVLHHSREKELLLSDEIEMLNLYIELEQLRFDHSFDLEMIIADDIDPENTYLPGMLLQPYIENAIWHGLVNLQGERRGRLTISFGREENYLTVKIEDNGIGRVKAKDYRKNTSHKSVSMDLTSERIQLMKAIYDFDHESIEIVDKSDKNNVPTGTIVLLHIPFI